MNDSSQQTRIMGDTVTDNSVKRTNEFGAGWALAGAALFAAAIAAPFGVMQMADRLAAPGQTLADGKVSVTAVADAPRAADPSQDLKTIFANAMIVPGTGIGTIALGQGMETVFERLPDQSFARGPADQPDAPERVTFRIGETRVELDAVDARLTRIALTAPECAMLERTEIREAGLPATAEGLSLGSHLSRVVAAMGTPLKGAPRAPIPGPMALPDTMVYEGLTFGLCPDSGLVNAIAVHRSDGLQADPVPVAVSPPADLMTLALGAVAHGDGSVTAMAAEPGRQSMAPAMPRALEAPVMVGDAALAARPSARPETAKTPGDLPLTVTAPDDAAMLATVPLGDQMLTREAPTAPNLVAGLVTVPDRLVDRTAALDPARPLAATKPGADLPVIRANPTSALAAIPAADRRLPTYRFAGDSHAALGPVDRLFRPGPPPAAVDLGPIRAALAPQLAEDELQLTRRTRQELQRRLRLIGYNPRGVDGIFGENTRQAIMDLQSDNDLNPTGFLDGDAKALLVSRSEQAYRNWRRKELRLAKQRRVTKPRPSVAPVAAMALPPSRPAPGCPRAQDGLIQQNASLGCDFEYLKEDFKALTRLFD